MSIRFRYSILREPLNSSSFTLVGVYSGEGPPVPIPNTAVKLTRVENTWLVTARKDRSSPTQTEKHKSASLFVNFLYIKDNQILKFVLVLIYVPV